jgi:pSer/pThr/pTyr-binding forkhead associated (FHA) protein
MQIRLEVLEGSQQGSELTVRGPKFLVGRDADCHLRPRSDLISRHHCVVIVEQGYAAVRDFNSKNGTFVNGVQITGECQLKAGDELLIGPLRFEVHLDYAVSGPKKPKVNDMKEALERTAERASDEFDISGWLDEDDDGDQGDTRDQIQLPLKDSTAPGVEKEPVGEETLRRSTDESTAGSKKTFNQEAAAELSKQPEDTRSAAAEVLKKLRDQKASKGKAKE